VKRPVVPCDRLLNKPFGEPATGPTVAEGKVVQPWGTRRPGTSAQAKDGRRVEVPAPMNIEGVVAAFRAGQRFRERIRTSFKTARWPSQATAFEARGPVAAA
jgi:hypothetical protein